MARIAGERIHGTTGRRPLEAFEEERGALLPLPRADFVPVTWKRATVHLDCNFVFDGRLYPAPWRTIGQQVWVQATPRTLDVYLDDIRLISHMRGVTAPREVYDLCLPPERSQLRHRSRSFWEERADAIAPEVGIYIREVFDQDDVLSQLRRLGNRRASCDTPPPWPMTSTTAADGPKPLPPRPRNHGRSLESPSRMRNSEDEGRR